VTRRIRWKIPALWCSLGNLTSARLTGYFLTPSVFIVVEAVSACKLLLQMCKLLSFLAARASVIERERERKGEGEGAKEGEGERERIEHRRRTPHRRVCRTSFSNFTAPFTSALPYLGIDPNFAAVVHSFKIPSNIRSEICRPTRQKLYSIRLYTRVFSAPRPCIVTSITLSTLIRISHLRDTWGERDNI